VNQKDVHLDGLIDSSKGLEGLESPWRLGLFGWPSKDPVKLEPPWLERMEVRQVGGVKYYVAHTNSGPGMPRSETWFAPNYNFLVAKTILYPDPKQADLYYVREVTDFAEPVKGIYFPRRVKMKKVQQGQERDEETATIDQIEVNRPVDPAEFALTFPAGTRVVDKPKGLVTQLGNDGRPTGDPEPLAPPRNVVEPKELPTSMRSGWLDRFGFWLLVVGGVLVGGLVVGGVVRYRRRARPAD